MSHDLEIRLAVAEARVELLQEIVDKLIQAQHPGDPLPADLVDEQPDHLSDVLRPTIAHTGPRLVCTSNDPADPDAPR